MALSLTEYNTSAAAAIAAGSVVEIAGAFFTFSSDETPTGWSSVVTATTGYIALTASGTAGSQVVNANYTSTAPTWRDDLQGWYASAASSVRIVASVYKAESASYYPKYVLKNRQTENTYSEPFLTISSSLSVVSSMTIASYPVYPYKTTTESILKSNITITTVTELTALSSCKAIVGAYSSYPTTTVSHVVSIFPSGGSFYAFTSKQDSATTPGITNLTYIVTYWY